MQAVLSIDSLPEDAVEAAACFYQEHLARVAVAIDEGATAIAIIVPKAGADHDHWLRALARDLGRKYAPARVNIVGTGDPQATQELLKYLESAPGVTGQYCPAHG